MRRKTLSREPSHYESSLFDRFKGWVETTPIPAWAFYGALGWMLVAAQLVSLRLDGVLNSGEITPVIVYNSFFTPFLLGFMHLLDRLGGRALRAMRRVLDLSEPDLERCRYRMSHMPFPVPTVVGIVMLALVVGMELVAATPTRYAVLNQARVFAPVFQLVDKSSAFLFGVVIYHTVRQLRLVNTITSRHVQVDLFNLGPLRAFSRITAYTAVGLLAGVYGWMVINPDLWRDPVILGVIGVLTLLAAVVFVWPLRGAHRLMTAAKEEALHDLERRFKAAFTAFNERLDAEDFAGAEALSGAIASLEIQRQRLSAVSTWPWRPHTVRFVLTAIALPLILGVAQYLIERALGP